MKFFEIYIYKYCHILTITEAAYQIIKSSFLCECRCLMRIWCDISFYQDFDPFAYKDDVTFLTSCRLEKNEVYFCPQFFFSFYEGAFVIRSTSEVIIL